MNNNQVKENQANEDRGKENKVKLDQVKENQGEENHVKGDQWKTAGKESSKRVKRSRTVGGRVNLQKLKFKEEEGRHCKPKSSEYESGAVEMEAETSAVKLNFESLNNNEEHWGELQKLSQRELLEDPDFLPFKPKKPRKSAPPITPLAPAMQKKSPPDVSKKCSPSGSGKSRKSEILKGEADRVADTRCAINPSLSL